MEKAVFDVQYLPSVFWFSRALKVRELVFERYESFPKSTARNRAAIATPHGRQLLTIPVAGGRDHHQLYTDVKIAYHNDWPRQHRQSLLSTYGSAPYFEHYSEIIFPFYETSHTHLYEHNLQLTLVLFKLLKHQPTYSFTKCYEVKPDNMVDYRSARGEASAAVCPRYIQVFEERTGFIPNLSVIDVLFNLGPAAKDYLATVSEVAP